MIKYFKLCKSGTLTEIDQKVYGEIRQLQLNNKSNIFLGKIFDETITITTQFIEFKLKTGQIYKLAELIADMDININLGEM